MYPRGACLFPEAEWPADVCRPFGHQPGGPEAYKDPKLRAVPGWFKK